MATILPFRPRQARRPTEGPATGCAEILIFTGVRYERIEEERRRAESPLSPSPKRSRGKR